ncbi:EF-P lysine aminoacylase EpmA [Thalassoroseus pseudoceratinae]|uniref:EF-P lysine aminoacylase EpmA n=1 Tax=Thalassoroseus pseudoceratinae TaxID=2713176 RepID=UPI00141D8D4F|nr:EF-P lysine aminoacylase EpmA [Thalassoroseus pseudoceratinae]
MTSNDFRPTAKLETLRRRAELLKSIRAAFHDAGYWEVETPILSHDTVVDAHLDPFVTHGTDATKAKPIFLQTSPEFAMKRLLAAGAEAIFQIGKVFRQGESGRLHNPEFTMIEWYQVGDDHHRQMDFTESLLRKVSPTLVGITEIERLTYDEAFERFTGQRVLSCEVSELREIADRHSSSAPSTFGNDRDEWLNFLLAELVEPHLGQEKPCFLYDYPASQAALAKIRSDSPPVAERFELYIRGVEICNGYNELIDPVELRRRIGRENEIRMANGKAALPTSNRLLDAMESGLPASSGVALGFDRLLLLLENSEDIADVIAFPFDRA